MKKYFVWTRDIERVICESLSDKRKRLASNSDAIVKLFGKAAEASEHYYSSTATMYELSRNWKNINKSSIYRMLERNQHLWEGVGLIFNALELQKVLAAPPGSIVVPTFSVGGYSFEIIKTTDPNYKDAFLRLSRADLADCVTGGQPAAFSGLLLYTRSTLNVPVTLNVEGVSISVTPTKASRSGRRQRLRATLSQPFPRKTEGLP